VVTSNGGEGCSREGKVYTVDNRKTVKKNVKSDYKKNNRSEEGRTEKGNYEKVGLSPIIRRKDYKQVNLTGIVENGKEKEYKIRFSRMFLIVFRLR